MIQLKGEFCLLLDLEEVYHVLDFCVLNHFIDNDVCLRGTDGFYLSNYSNMILSSCDDTSQLITVRCGMLTSLYKSQYSVSC